jgi:hypothetical protein
MTALIVWCSQDSYILRRFYSGISDNRWFSGRYLLIEHPQGVLSSLISPGSVSSSFCMES